MKMIAAGLTNPGRVRKNNEDNFWADPDLGLLIVADGMGGHAAGEVASQMAVDVVKEQVALGLQTGQIPQLGGRRPQLSEKGALLEAALKVANEVIFSAAQEKVEKKGMGTTIVAVLVDKKNCVVAHVGDSRGYLFRHNALMALTQDHSLVAEQVAKGLLTKAEAERSKIRNVLTRALGVGAEVEVDVSEHPLQPGDKLLLCTDGLCGLVSESDMEAALRRIQDPVEICQTLVDAANNLGGKDNITVVLGQMERFQIMNFFKSFLPRSPETNVPKEQE